MLFISFVVFVVNYLLGVSVLAFLEQDEGLDALVDVIQRQKMMGRNIGDEVDYQNGR